MSDESRSFLSQTQKRVIAIALALGSFLAIIAFLVLIVFVLSRVVSLFSGVLWPLAVAGIIALILRPVVGLFQHTVKMSRIGSTVILYGLFLLVVFGLAFLFLPAIIGQTLDFIESLPHIGRSLVSAVQENYPRWVQFFQEQMKNDTFRHIVNSSIEQLRSLSLSMLPNLKSAGSQVLGVFGFAAGLAIIPVYLFFFLQSDEDPTLRLPDYLPFLKDETREDVVFLCREFIGIVVSFFRGQLLIGLIMGVLLATGFTIAGLRFGILLGLMAGMLNVVPYLGTIIGLSTTLPTAYLQDGGGIGLAGIVLGVFILVQMIEGYFLTPRIMGDRTGLHPVAIIIAIFFWGTALGGILGMVLAIPLTAFFVTAWRLAKRKYLTKLV